MFPGRVNEIHVGFIDQQQTIKVCCDLGQRRYGQQFARWGMRIDQDAHFGPGIRELLDKIIRQIPIVLECDFVQRIGLNFGQHPVQGISRPGDGHRFAWRCESRQHQTQQFVTPVGGDDVVNADAVTSRCRFPERLSRW